MIYIHYTIAMSIAPGVVFPFLRHFDFNFFGLKLSSGLIIAIYILRCRDFSESRLTLKTLRQEYARALHQKALWS